jgi:hypothetical protein
LLARQKRTAEITFKALLCQASGASAILKDIVMITQLRQQILLALRIALIAVSALVLPMHTTDSKAHSMASTSSSETNVGIGLRVVPDSESTFQSAGQDPPSNAVVYTSDIFLPITVGIEKYPPDNRAFELELLRLIGSVMASVHLSRTPV